MVTMMGMSGLYGAMPAQKLQVPIELLGFMPIVQVSNDGGKMEVFVLSKGWVSMQDQVLMKKINDAWEMTPKENSFKAQQANNSPKSEYCCHYGYDGTEMFPFDKQAYEKYKHFLKYPTQYGYSRCQVNTVDMRTTYK